MKSFSLLFLCALLPGLAYGALSERAEVMGFVDEMVNQHGFSRSDLLRLFERIELRPDVIEIITRPAESKPWHKYRPIFLTRERILEGVKFWNRHAQTLARAEEEYGVPAGIVVAILGVETHYGRLRGNHRVADALATLAFDYPPRAGFFRGQLAEYLLMTKEEGFDPLAMKGSYAGAMGQPQFIASSFRTYAVDFDGDGKRDLWESTDDVIGSVANYFYRHHWQRDGAVAYRAEVRGQNHAPLLEEGYRPNINAADLADHGVSLRAALNNDEQVSLIALEGETGPEYWVGLQNFYVITRYNRSPLYAMAVFQLSEAIRTTRAAK